VFFLNTYASTFASGFQKVVAKALKEEVTDCKIKHLFDGLIVFDTNIKSEIITRLKFFNNTFLIVDTFKNLNPNKNPVDQMMTMALKSNRLAKSLEKIGQYPRKGSSFRIIFSNKNELVSVNKQKRDQIEKIVAQKRRLVIDRVLPNNEFWYLYRTENIGFFMLRLTKQPSADKTLHKGALRPEISNLLCRMSEPKESEIFLDPFCGYGSIPIERYLSFPSPNLIFARDKDKEMTTYTKEKMKQSKIKREKVIVQNADLFGEKRFDDNFIDKIVTDPPWGIYEDLGENLQSFYSRMLAEFIRIVKAHGIIVILTAKKEEMEKSINKVASFIQKWEKIDVLVSGKKASVYKIIKK
jgi:tRNA G10  N-methylase Trm11